MGDDGAGAVGLVVGDELGEFFFQQFVFGLEAGYQVEDLFQDFAQGEASVNGGGLPQLLQGVVVLGLVEHLAVYVVQDRIPVSGFDGLLDGDVGAHSVCEAVEQHTVNLHALRADGFLPDGG